MSLAEEMLANMSVSDDSVSYLADEEPHIVINESRQAIVPNELKTIAVTGDKDIETVTFDCVRYWDNHDLSTFAIYLNYVLPDLSVGTYIPESIVADGDVFHFDWNIKNNITVKNGKISFAITAIKTKQNESGETVVDKQWGSLPNSDCSIALGLDISNVPSEEESSDVLAQMSAILEQIQEDFDEWLQNNLLISQTTGDSETAVMSQKATTEAIDGIFEKPDIINYFDKSKCVIGSWINVQNNPPTIDTNLSYLFYTYIPIKQPTKTYYFKWAAGSIGTLYYKVAFYNENKDFVGYSNAVYVSGTGNDTIVSLTVPTTYTTAKYFGYSQANSKIDDLMVCVDAYPAEYIPYNDFVTRPNLVISREQIKSDNPLEYMGEQVRAFTKGFFGGDSLTKGTFNHNGTGTEVFEVIQKYSYPSYFGKLYGCEVANWGIGGETTKSWYELVSADGRSTDYDFAVIALGANDTKINDNSVSKTYYQRIIDMLKSDVNGVKIFCCTVTPAYTETNPTFYESYNENVVKAIVNENSDCYLIDLARYSKCHKDTVYAQGHLTALGYLQQAKEIGSAISYIINDKPNEFRYIQFIGTNYSHT